MGVRAVLVGMRMLVFMVVRVGVRMGVGRAVRMGMRMASFALLVSSTGPSPAVSLPNTRKSPSM